MRSYVLIIQLDELSETMRQQISEQEQLLKGMDTGLAQTAADYLRSDDKLLLSLQKLASDLEPIRSDDEEAVARVRDLCTRSDRYSLQRRELTVTG
jgi:hypothetical protein